MIKIRLLVMTVLLGLGVLSVPLQAGNVLALKGKWSPQGDKIAISDKKELVIYDDFYVQEQRLSLFEADEQASSLKIIWSPLQDKIAVQAVGTFANDVEGLIRIWDLTTGERLGEIADISYSYNVDQVVWLPHNEPLSVLTFSQETPDYQLDFYSADGTHIDTMTDPDGFIAQAWTDDGELLVTGSNEDIPLDLWDAESKEHIDTVGFLDITPAVHLSPNNRFVAVLSGMSSVLTVWDLENRDSDAGMEFVIPRLEDDPSYNIYHLMFGWQSDNRLWSIGVDNFMYVWRFKVSKPIGKFPIDVASLQDINPDGTRALYAEGAQIRVEEIETGKVLAYLDMTIGGAG